MPPRFEDADLLPVVDTMCAAHPSRCKWGCGNQCAHTPPNTSEGETFVTIVARRFSRRRFLQSTAAAAGLVVAAGTPFVRADGTSAQTADGAGTGGALPQAGSTGLGFAAISGSSADALRVAAGYRAETVIAYGDPLFTGAGPEGQFGYNNDFVGFLPVAPNRGLLLVNHEYTNPELIFPGYDSENPTQEQVDTELNAHGFAVVELRRNNRPAGVTGFSPHGPIVRRTSAPMGRPTWNYQVNGRYNRRITATTPMAVSGPAAGHPLLRTSADPDGTTVLGMLNNCGAGITPWKTVLTCEENFNQYFANREGIADGTVAEAHARYGLPAAASERKWERFYDRFDLAQEPNEAFRFGWVVEIDPFDPDSTPKKRTALGRFKHEAATTVISSGGHAVVYTGDDERFDYMYKFVSNGTYDADAGAANGDLLDDGTLYVAKFNDDGTGEWIPLVHGEGPLTGENGFDSQGAVLILTRLAGDAVGATKMDRPEDIETNPVNGKVYCVMTNNTQRGTEDRPGIDAANPRATNTYGHIIELTPDGDDHAAETFTWEIFMLCGEPEDESTYFAGFDKSQVSAISSPDNITFDQQGNLWIATDGQPGTLGINDSVYAVPTDGPDRGWLRRFFSAVPGAETASLCFDASDEALFVAIQHPAEGSSLAAPSSTFPDGSTPRPAVVVIVKEDGGVIGS